MGPRFIRFVIQFTSTLFVPYQHHIITKLSLHFTSRAGLDHTLLNLMVPTKRWLCQGEQPRSRTHNNPQSLSFKVCLLILAVSELFIYYVNISEWKKCTVTSLLWSKRWVVIGNRFTYVSVEKGITVSSVMVSLHSNTIHFKILFVCNSGSGTRESFDQFKMKRGYNTQTAIVHEHRILPNTALWFFFDQWFGGFFANGVLFLC